MAWGAETGRGFRAADIRLYGQMQDRRALGKQTFRNCTAGRAFRQCLPEARTHRASASNYPWSKTPSPLLSTGAGGPSPLTQPSSGAGFGFLSEYL